MKNLPNQVIVAHIFKILNMYVDKNAIKIFP